MVKRFVVADTPKLQHYIRIYKDMLQCAEKLQLNLVAIMLYALLMHRASLSHRNGWRDEQGRIFVIMTREEAARELGCTKGTAVKAFKALVGAGLLEEKARVNRRNCMIAPYLFLKQWGCPSSRLSIEQIIDGTLPYLTSANINVI